MDDENPPDDAGDTPLHVAVEGGFSTLCKFILENVEDKHPKNNKNKTPYQVALQLGYSRIANFFVNGFRKTKL